jgi:hypothetical protein
MIWLFDRDGEKLKYEICRDEEGEGYMLVVTSSDGQKHIERVDQPTALIELTVAQMRQLKDDGWRIG